MNKLVKSFINHSYNYNLTVWYSAKNNVYTPRAIPDSSTGNMCLSRFLAHDRFLILLFECERQTWLEACMGDVLMSRNKTFQHIDVYISGLFPLCSCHDMLF